MNKTTILLLALQFLLAGAGVAQRVCPPKVQWQRTYGGTNNENCRFVAQLQDGGYLLAGATSS